MSDATEKDFFISYTRTDKAWALWIAAELEAMGYTTVYEHQDFGAGRNWALEMDRAIKEAKRTVILLSPKSLESTYTKPEWAAAFAKDPTGEARKLIPIRVEACIPDGLLGQVVYVDLVGKDEDVAKEELREQLKDISPSTPAPKAEPARPTFPGGAVQRRWALIASAEPDDGAVVSSTLQSLAPPFRVPEPLFLDSEHAATAQKVLKALSARGPYPADQEIWVYLRGRLESEYGLPVLKLGPHPSNTLTLLQFLHVLAEEVKAEKWMVLIDADPDSPGINAALALPWPDMVLFAIGSKQAGTLSKYLQSGEPGPRRADRLARALGGRSVFGSVVLNEVLRSDQTNDSKDPEAELQERGYLRCLERQTRRLEQAFQEKGEHAPHVDAVYVEPLTRAHYSREEKDKRREPEEARPAFVPLKDRAAETPYLFLEGAPGSGKSTFLNRLAWDLCRHTTQAQAVPEGFPARAFPVRIILRTWAAERSAEPPTAAGLLDYAFRRLSVLNQSEPLNPAIAHRALAEGRVVLLVDGLDEVPGTALRRQVGEVLTELADTHERCKIVVTCRPAAAEDGARPGAPFVSATIEPFEPDQQSACVHKWLTQRIEDPAEATEEAERLLRDLARHPAVRQQAQNPLVLTMICILFRREGALPRSRGELYRRLIDLLLKDRDRPWDGPAQRIDLDDRWTAIRAIAVAWRNAPQIGDQKTALLLRPACITAIKNTLDLEREEILDLLRFFEQRTALLDWESGDSDQRRLRFTHRTLAEYLVAGDLAANEKDAVTQLHAHALDGDWREIILLFVNIIGRDAQRTHQAVHIFIETLIGDALNRSESAARATYGRLATECLAELDYKVPIDLADKGAELETQLFGHPKEAANLPVRERVRFWDARGQHRRDLTEDQRWVEIPEGTYWRGVVPHDEDPYGEEGPGHWVWLPRFEIQRWPVTVQEYESFVDAGGYTNETWWTPWGWSFRKTNELSRPDRWLLQLDRPSGPVTEVSWFEAQAYARWLEAQYEPQGSDRAEIRLPTEAEWEAAARGVCKEQDEKRAQSVYPWGDKWDAKRANNGELGLDRTSPVGTFRAAHPLDLWDMSGNAYELCLDPLSDSYKAELEGHPADKPLIEPTRFNKAKSIDETTRRIIRGGSFRDLDEGLRVSYRSLSSPENLRLYRIGFRVIRVFSPRTLVS